MSWGRVDGRRVVAFGTPGQLRRELVALVVAGRKKATAGLWELDYVAEDEVLEHVGEQLAVVDDDGAPAAVITIDRVDVVPFAAVTWEFADAEGEDFTSVEDWRDGHRRFWSRMGVQVRDDSEVVCLWFHVEDGPAGQSASQ